MCRAIIIAGGDHPSLTKAFFRKDDIIIAADKGAHYALKMGITLAAVVGDFDSLPRESIKTLQSLDIKIEQHPTAKDQTDLELAIEKALTFKPKEIIFIGMLGGRLDHLLANVMILTSPLLADIKTSIQDGGMEAYRLFPRMMHKIVVAPGDIISLIPISSTVRGVTLKGTRWPLENATLSRGSSLTISNEALDSLVTADFKEGQLLLIRYAK